MKHSFQVALVLFASMVLFSCGNSATSTNPSFNPATLFNSDASPQLASILSSGNYSGATLSSGFSSTNPYWVFNANTGSGNYTAPADGYVSRIDLAQLNGVTVTYVTILHSGHLATRVFGMQVVSVRAGDTVLQGSVMGQYLNSGQVAFQVLWDNTPVCPLSYISSAFRTSLAAGYYAQLCL